MRIFIILGLLVGVGAVLVFFFVFHRKLILRVFFNQGSRDRGSAVTPSGGPARGGGGGSRGGEAGGRERPDGLPAIIQLKPSDSSGKVISYAELAATTRHWADALKLGAGSAATVYRAELPHFGAVALKRFRPEREQANRDFSRELDALSSCRHPHILEILGQSFEGPEKVLVMPLMEGGTLGAALHAMPWSLRAIVVGQVVRAVAFLHARSFLHRDIKSSNILLDRSLGHARLADFGLAKEQARPQGHGSTGIVVGSPGYMAPELMMRPASEKTDAYALGVVHLEILTGLPAWQDDVAAEEDQALTDRVVQDGTFVEGYIDSQAGWVSEAAATCAAVAVALTLFDPSRRRNVTSVESDAAYGAHLAKAATARGLDPNAAILGRGLL